LIVKSAVTVVGIPLIYMIPNRFDSAESRA
jgi:hypothetical protein